jgi:uncharacterized protein
MAPSWSVTPEKVQSAIQRIVSISQPKKLILFGSYVRKELHPHSDLDILVVVNDDVQDRRKESIRIRRHLRGIVMPMDILVIPESEFIRLAAVPGLVYEEAVRHGQVVYEAA